MCSKAAALKVILISSLSSELISFLQVHDINPLGECGGGGLLEEDGRGGWGAENRPLEKQQLYSKKVSGSNLVK